MWNADKARLQGTELETRAKLFGTGTNSPSLAGSLGQIDAPYTHYVANNVVTGIFTPTDVAAFGRIQKTQAWTGNASLTLSTEIASGRIDLQGGMSFKSKATAFEIANPCLDQQACQLSGASTIYHASDNSATIGVYTRSLRRSCRIAGTRPDGPGRIGRIGAG